ncbi:hypothetical protein MASR1M101_22760 [Gemmatimonas sp.]
MLWVAVLVMFGCGGGDGAPPITPPATPNPAIPASLVVTTGADQFVEPATSVSVRPVLVVRNAAGLPVPSVDVTFSVDSGGGTLIGPVVVRTSNDGQVTAPDWRAGSAEGPQVLLAQVGTISVRVRATARYALVALAPVAVPGEGGVVRFSRAGLPLDGFAVQVPAGAFTGATLGLTLESTVGLALPEGSAARSPAVRLVPSGGAQRKAVAATFPLTAADTGVMVVIGRDVGNATWRVLPPIGATANSLTVSVPVSLSSPSGSALRRFAAQVETTPTRPSIDIMVLLQLDRRLLRGDFRTGFQPGVDEWAMLPLNTYGASTEARPTELLYQSLLVAPAYSAVHYFLNLKSVAGQPLNRQAVEAEGVLRSHRRAYLLNSAVEANAPDLTEARGVDAFLLNSLASDRRRLAEQSFLATKAMLSISRLAPQVAGVYARVRATGQRVLAGAVIIGTVDSSVVLTNPFRLGDSLRVTLASDGFRPVAATLSNGIEVEVEHIGILPIGSSFYDDYLSLLFRSTTDALATAARWPTSKLMSAFGELDARDVVILDTLRHWWECERCEPSGYQAESVPNRRVQPFYRTVQRPDGSWPDATTVFGSQSLSESALPSSGRAVVGVQLIQPVNGGPGDIGTPHWLDWREIRYRRLVTSLRPRDSVLATTDTTVTFQLTVTDPPTGLRYRWTLRSTNGDSTETTAPQLVRTLPVLTEGFMVVTVLQGEGKRAIGRDSVYVRIRDGTLALSPSPLIGGYGVGYTVRATFEGSVPPTARWHWSRGDGSPDTVTTAGQLTVRYGANSGRHTRSFDIAVQLRDGTRTLGTGRTTAEIGRGFPVWRVTQVTIEEFETGTGALEGGTVYADGLSYDRSFWTTVRDQGRQGGLLFMERDTVLSDGRMRPRGLYSIDADSLSPARINDALSVPANVNTYITSVSGVRGLWQLHPATPPRQSHNDSQLDEQFASSVNWVTGSMSGVVWQLFVTEQLGSSTYRFPRKLRRVSATMADSTISATLEYIYRNHTSVGAADWVERGRRTLRVTVQGVRIK